MKFSKGFTIIELLIYIAIATILLFGLTSLIISTVETRERSKVVNEVERQGAQIMELITRTVRNADSISSPTTGNSANSLSLVLDDPGKNPTVFSLSDGNLRITEGANTPNYLHNNLIVVTSLDFKNLSYPLTSGNVQVRYVLKYNNTSGRPIYNFEKRFQSSASLK